jgi:hypothetical protein
MLYFLQVRPWDSFAREVAYKPQHEIAMEFLYRMVDIDFDIVETAKTVQGLELHDRLIVST